jgi:glutamate carboxypeptidase
MKKTLTEFLSEFVDSRRYEMTALWQKLVDIDTGPGCASGLNEAASVLSDRIGASCSFVRREKFNGAPDTVVATRNGNGRKDGRVVLLGHMDTVFPEGAAKERPFSVRADIATGPGVYDMKGGLVQIVYALEALDAAGWRDREVVAVISGDEETGHRNSVEGSDKLFSEAARGTAALFCCESGLSDDSLVIARKGVGEIVVTTRGRSAHAGNDFKSGANAIVEISGKVAEIASLFGEDDAKTLNVGLIRGGMASNSVPDFAEITVDVRIQDAADWSVVLRRVAEVTSKTKVPGTSSSMRSRLEIPAMKPSGETMKLLKYVSGIREKISGGTLRGASVGGGADSSFFAARGVPCLCAMGPVGASNHTPEEWASVSSLFERTKLLAEAVMEL